MKKLVLFLFLVSGLLFGRDYYQKDRILFCLQKDLPYLTVSFENGIAQTGMPGLDALLKKYQVSKLEKGFKSADETNVVGETDLSRVYSAEFETPKEWDDLWSMISDFTSQSQIISGDLSSINYPATVPQVDAYVPDDSRYNEQWSINKIQANYAWGLWDTATPGDPGVLVGVVDTGVDTEHPDLQGVLYLNPGEDLNGNGVVDPSEENNVDDDGNGYIDDFYGYDFADNDNNIRPPDAGPDQELSHGTHCTGIMGAVTDNATGVAGISFRSKVIATKNSRDTDTINPGITEGYDAILYCAKLGAKFINCSWGGSYLTSYERNILDDVSDNYGAIVVSSAGNEERDNDVYPSYPANYSKVISVAATTTTDRKSYYSNWGSNVDISAPAGEYSSSSTATLSTIHANAGSYAAWQGTSMASPMVVGALALLKAWYPSATREWLFDEILVHADPIDDLNPDYAGELGGRLNIYNAISRNSFPYLTVSNSSYTIIDDDGDGQLNPGESANLVLTVENDPLWLDASSTTVTLSSSSPYVTFSDANASLGTIIAGNSVTTTSGDLVFALTTSATIGPLPITVTMEANPTAAHPYSFSQDIEVTCSMNQMGFPVTKIGMPTPVAAADLLGDPKKEIIACGNDDSVYVYYSDGTLASGFPVYMGAYTSMAPAVADVDNDGVQEIVICEEVNGYLKIIENDGTLLLDHTVGQQIRGEISLANMDADSDLEIIFGTYSEKKVHVLNIDGTYVSGFPTAAYPSLIDQNIAVGDVTGDGNNELVFGLFNTDMYIIDNTGATLPNFPLNLSARINTGPIIVDAKDSVMQVIVTTTNKKIQRFDKNGNILMEHTLSGNVLSTPAVADFNKDFKLDIIFGTDDSKIWVMGFGGDTLAPYPLTVDGDPRTSPVFADLDNDLALEMMISTDAGYIYTLKPDGSDYVNFPANLESAQNGSGCVADIDNDNDYEFIVGGDNGLNVIDITATKGTTSGLWQTYHANNARTAYSYFDLTPNALESIKQIPREFTLEQNYPNPFNPQTNIKYSLLNAADVSLDIYNVLGQKVRTLVNEQKSAGYHDIVWDGRNDLGQHAGSGIYFYKLNIKSGAKNLLFQRKMLLIR